MPEWLVAYLAFSVAGGITTYITVLREADKIYREVTEDESKLGFMGFAMWSLASIVIAPILALVVLRGKTEELAEGIAVKWVEDARHND
jgi:hypothetical protein